MCTQFWNGPFAAASEWLLNPQGEAREHPSQNNPQENDVDEFIEYLKISKLTDTDRDRMEGPLSYEECKKALDTFQNNKAPGEDGFTVEFYTFFFRSARPRPCC